MWEPWLSVGQEDEFRPYNEPPCDYMDPWVTKKVMNPGFEWDQIQDALKFKRYNRVVAKIPEVESHIMVGNPFRFPDLNSHSPSPTQEVQP